MRNNYYHKHKESLQNKTRKRDQNLSEEQKQKLVEYGINYFITHNK